MTKFTNDQISDQLTTGYWGGSRNTLTPSRDSVFGPSNVITYDISDLTGDGQFYARNAFDVWRDASGLTFRQARPWERANITFDDDEPGAFAYPPNLLNLSRVNVSTDWIHWDDGELDTYSFQTFIHEIGHALGLGHGGNYKGSAAYGKDNHYDNDSWQASVMSYFNQTENTTISGSFAYVMTPQVADILAIQSLYGTTSLARPGNTTYGNNSNAGGIWDEIFSFDRPLTATIVDSGGYDTLDFSTWNQDQTIDLNAEAVSSVAGATGNLMIARGTVLEQARTGSGNDVLVGNHADNVLYAGNGSDVLYGGDGDDDLHGGGGNDILYANSGYNLVHGGTGHDTIHSSGKGVYLGGYGDDLIFAMTGTAASGRNELLNGGYGNDTLDTTSFNGDYHVNLETGKTNWTGESFTDFENLRLGSGNDIAIGTLAANMIWLAAGNDHAYAGEGDDVVYGGSGDDLLDGGTGNDILKAGTGENYVFGGQDNDTIHSSGKGYYDGGTGDDLIFAMTGTTASGREEKLFGGHGIDTLDTTSFNGDYHVNLQTGKTNWHGETFREFENLRLGGGSDIATGTEASNKFWLGDGDDRVYGAGGSDEIHGGGGSDFLYGGAGADTFYFQIGGDLDIIFDYEHGVDLLYFEASGLVYADLTFSDLGWATEVQFSSTDSVVLAHVSSAELSEDDFAFV